VLPKTKQLLFKPHHQRLFSVKPQLPLNLRLYLENLPLQQHLSDKPKTRQVQFLDNHLALHQFLVHNQQAPTTFLATLKIPQPQYLEIRHQVRQHPLDPVPILLVRFLVTLQMLLWQTPLDKLRSRQPILPLEDLILEELQRAMHNHPSILEGLLLRRITTFLAPHQHQPNHHSISVVVLNQVLVEGRHQRHRSALLNNLPLEHLNHLGRVRHRLIRLPPQLEAVSQSEQVEINQDAKLREQDVASNVNKKSQNNFISTNNSFMCNYWSSFSFDR